MCDSTRPGSRKPNDEHSRNTWTDTAHIRYHSFAVSGSEISSYRPLDGAGDIRSHRLLQDRRPPTYPGGVLGDLSITTQILLASIAAKQVLRIDVLSDRDRATILFAAAGAGLFLYPLSSGLMMLDVYSLGFHSTTLMLGLAVLAVIGWYVRTGAAFIIPLGVIAFNFELLASNNVWDYLLDPLLALFAWGWALLFVVGRTFVTPRPTADSNP